MFGTTIATSTVDNMLTSVGTQSINATVYTVVAYWPWLILAAVVGYVIYLGRNILHIR